MPEEDHPLFPDFDGLRIESLGHDYTEQKKLLDKRHEIDGTDVFVASYSAIENKTTKRQFSYSTWTSGVDTWLPETDLVFFIDPNAPKDKFVVAQGDWATVRRVAGDLMEKLDVYPVRWRVTQFPDEEMLAEIGMGEF